MDFCFADSPAAMELKIEAPWNQGGRRRLRRGVHLRGQAARTSKRLTFAKAIGDIAKVDLVKDRLRITIPAGDTTLKVDFRDAIQ